MAAIMAYACSVRRLALQVSKANSTSICYSNVLRLYSVSKICGSKKEPKIYTKTGDKGTTSLFTGERRSKSDQVFKALGTTDELSSALGLAREFCIDVNNNRILGQLEDIQCILQDIGSHIATPLSSASANFAKRTEFTASTEDLENWIDTYSEELPPLRNFILPSGGKSSAALHVARSVCRRLERALIPSLEAGDIDNDVFKYINRLSDFLFAAARYAAKFDGKEEFVYKRKLKTVKTT